MLTHDDEFKTANPLKEQKTLVVWLFANGRAQNDDITLMTFGRKG